MNTPTPDYGEPWSAFDFDQCKTRHGAIFELIAGTRNRSIACVNACAGMADPAAEIAAMREALREAHTSLNLCSGIIGAPFDTEWKSVEECDAAYGSAKSTLAKLQPFIK